MVAIIAADFTPPAQAQAQRDEVSSGQIIASRGDDDRIEFGWRTPSGAEYFPRARYLSQDGPEDRWLSSSPVIIDDGTTIGRINAKLHAGGRIEFGFTTIKGWRILPPARYFPANAERGRWLHSTSIEIDAPPAFRAVSAGHFHTCAIRTSGAITCWGFNGAGQTNTPAGRFAAVGSGSNHSCGLRESGAIECWGHDRETNVPEETFIAISTKGTITCAITSMLGGANTDHNTGRVKCWGSNYYDTWQLDAPDGRFRAVSTNGSYPTGYGTSGNVCGLRGNGAIECWGSNHFGQLDVPDGEFRAVSVSVEFTCAIRTNYELECWGTGVERDDVPDGRYAAISTSRSRDVAYACAIRAITGTIECWGISISEGYSYGEQLDAPVGKFRAISTGTAHTCAIRATSGEMVCWGWNNDGQTDVPTS